MSQTGQVRWRLVPGVFIVALLAGLAGEGTAQSTSPGPGPGSGYTGAAAGGGMLELGVLPYINMEGLLETYGPLAHYMERELGRPVRIVSAKDYPNLVRLTAAKAYPLLVTASHFARLAEVDTGYVPLLRPLTTYHELLLVHRDSAITAIAGLKGVTIASPDIYAQINIMMRAMLRHYGVDPDTDVTMLGAGSHKNAVHAVLNGTAQAAVVSEGAFRHMEDGVKRDVRPLLPGKDFSRVGAIPVVYMASPEMPAAEVAHLAAVMSRFANEDPDGRAWINKLGYQGLRPPTAAEMEALDVHVHELRKVLSGPRTGL